MNAQIASPQEAQEWYKIITDFPGFFSNYQNNYNGLVSQGNYIYAKHPEWKSDYDALLNKSTDTYNKLFSIKESIDNIKSNWSDFTSWLSGVTGIGSLGILPLIWAGVGAASAAAIIYEAGQLLGQMADRASRYNMAKDYEAKGMTPAQAAAQVKGVLGAPGSSGTLFGIPYLVWALGAAAVLLGPTLLKRLR